MADDAASEADSETVRGFPLDSGTDTESIASSRSTDFNRKKKEKQKAAKKRAKELAKAQAAAAEASAAGSSSSAAPEGVVVEYVSSKSDDLENPAFAEFASVFGKFAAAEDLVSSREKAAMEEAEASEAAAAKARAKAAADALLGAEKPEDGEKELSKRAKKRAKRLSIAELKQLVKTPEVVESWDVTADDPRLLVHLKSYRNTIPVPKHWAQKRKFLMGKRGVEKIPFQLPEFIAATGIEKIRAAVLEKEQNKKLKGKMKEKMQPKMGKIDIDYQVRALQQRQRPSLHTSSSLLPSFSLF